MIDRGGFQICIRQPQEIGELMEYGCRRSSGIADLVVDVGGWIRLCIHAPRLGGIVHLDGDDIIGLVLLRPLAALLGDETGEDPDVFGRTDLRFYGALGAGEISIREILVGIPEPDRKLFRGNSELSLSASPALDLVVVQIRSDVLEDVVIIDVDQNLQIPGGGGIFDCILKSGCAGDEKRHLLDRLCDMDPAADSGVLLERIGRELTELSHATGADDRPLEGLIDIDIRDPLDRRAASDGILFCDR
jgi:hypothetical protein